MEQNPYQSPESLPNGRRLNRGLRCAHLPFLFGSTLAGMLVGSFAFAPFFGGDYSEMVGGMAVGIIAGLTAGAVVAAVRARSKRGDRN
jgi:hypothetical protein